MKDVKKLGLVAMAAMALAAFAASTASAADLYSTGVKVPVGASLHATLEAGSTMVFSTTDGSSIVNTCTASTVEGEVDSTGGANVTSAIDALTWGPTCSVTTDTLTNGKLHIDRDGTVRSTISVITLNIGISCRYGTGGGTDVGTLNTGKLAINAVIKEQEPKAFLCPDTIKWVANYRFTSPHDLTAG